MQIDTHHLKQKAQILKRKMQEIIRDIQKQQRQQSISLEDEMQSMHTKAQIIKDIFLTT